MSMQPNRAWCRRVLSLVFVVLLVFVWCIRFPHMVITWGLGLVCTVLTALVAWSEGIGRR